MTRKALAPRERGATQEAAGYRDLLEELKARIRQAQLRAAVAVNQELLRLYWQIGRDIVRRQELEGWGAAVIERLAQDLRRAFPETTGFSASNIWRMRAFYLAHRTSDENLAQPVREMAGEGLPPSVPYLPWGHQIVLVEKVKDLEERAWYGHAAVEHDWSRNVLLHQIDSRLYHRQGQAVTNFVRTLPAPQSDLARELLKDPYNFDFLGMDEDLRERDLERALLAQVRDFLLELGAGFALVGSQHHLEVAEQDYYIDLLFYHLRLRCFVAVELKVGAFEPEHAGKMNFYLTALDDQLRHDGDQPSIGLILCKERNRVVVEYALRTTQRPIGVAQYHVTKQLPVKLRGSLPTVEELERGIGGVKEPSETGGKSSTTE